MSLLTVLGSTGSIGRNTLDVVRQHQDRFKIYALAAGQNVAETIRQILEFRPQVVVMASEKARMSVFDGLRDFAIQNSEVPELLTGPEALIASATAPEVDVVMSSIVGVAGLEATYEAVRCGKRIGLANKEVLVSAGALVMEAVRESGAEMIPVDSEHNAAHQCLRSGSRGEARRLILTASGGPFRNTPADVLENVTPAEALNHPTWKMGNRITIDSATLMNKGFEVIEACWLFDFTPDEVDVVVHPQSTVHAMVEYNDGSVIAQVSATDMRMPIQYALTWPERAAAPVPKIDWSQPRHWDFAPPDNKRFPLLQMAYDAQRAGGTSTCTLNAADEVAVEAFLGERIGFGDIASVVRETLERVPVRTAKKIADILEIDREARAVAATIVSQRSENRSRLITAGSGRDGARS